MDSPIINFHDIEFECRLVDGKVWFHSQSVAKYLGFKNAHTAIELHCNESHTSKWHFGGHGRPATYLSIAGVCRLCFKSTNPKAIEFQDWVMDEVVPQIITGGAYLSPDITPEQALVVKEKVDRILEVANPWERMYQKEACDKAFKWFGSDFYWVYAYSWMTPAEICKLNRVNPVINGDREQRIHQHLEQETRDRLAPHATRLVDFLISSTSKQDFQTRMGRIFGSDQQELDLG